jgi:hypothetical protein
MAKEEGGKGEGREEREKWKMGLFSWPETGEAGDERAAPGQ